MFYTGVGSRDTPPKMLGAMTRAAQRLSAAGYILRSGGAQGADTAFAAGASAAVIYFGKRWMMQKVPLVKGHTYICLEDMLGEQGEFGLWGSETTAAAEHCYFEAHEVHPNWGACTTLVRDLHARNVLQVRGTLLNEPSEFLLCWAPPDGDSVKGGTRTAWEVARNAGVLRYNLASKEDIQRFAAFMKEKGI